MMFMSLFDDSTFCHHTDLHRNPSSIHHSQRTLFMNKAVEKHLSDPYNRLRYLYDFLDRDNDDDMNAKCYPLIYHYLSTVTDSEAHY